MNKEFQNNQTPISGDLSTEGNLCAMPPAMSLTAGAADPNLGKIAQRKSTENTEKKSTRLDSIKVPGVPQNIVNKIAESEGIRLDVYKDSRGLPTVGIGHLLSEAENKKWKIGDVLTEAEIVAFAKADIGKAWDAAVSQAATIKVSDSAFTMALFEVNFQLGEYWYTKHTKTWGYMKEQEWEEAAKEAENSKWASQTPVRVSNFQKALRKLNNDNAKEEGGFNLWNRIKSGTTPDGKDGESGLWKMVKKQTGKLDAPATETETASPDNSQTSEINAKASFKLSASVGRGGKNLPSDLQLLAGFLQKAGAGPRLVSEMMNPAENGAVIERYQREVLGFSKADGRIDPGGKTFKAISELKGRDVVTEWYSQPKEEAAPEEDQKLMDLVSDWFGIGKEKEEAAGDDLGDFSDKELDVKKYWEKQPQGKGNCDVFAKKVITGHKRDNPELYKEFGDVGSDLTARKNSLHLVWEDEWEKAGARKQGQRGANDISTLVKDGDEWGMAIRYITSCVNAGVPVMAGVNHTFAYGRAAANNDKTTDHWITIIGKGADQKGKYFIYTDPGTRHGKKTENNRLYQTENEHLWIDETKYAEVDAGKGSYTLVAVSLYNKHRGKNQFKVGNEEFVRKI